MNSVPGSSPGTESLKGSCASGSEGYISPFRGARPNLFIFGFPVPEILPYTFRGTHGYSWANVPNRTGFQPEQ